MRFMTLVKSAENVGQPPPELFAAIAQLGAEAAEKGVFVDTGGLLPTATGSRIRLSGGKLTVTDGPFAEAKEVIGGYAFYEVESKEEAVEWANRFMTLHQELWPGWEGETEIRQVFEPGKRPIG
jgi:hypothetical protein